MSEPKTFPDYHFNLAYFKKEACELRRLMGQRDFWAKSATERQHALNGFGFVFLNLVSDDGKALSKEDNDFAANIYYGTVDEYGRREVMALFSGRSA